MRMGESANVQVRNTNDMTGKVCLVTGANAGLGLAAFSVRRRASRKRSLDTLGA